MRPSLVLFALALSACGSSPEAPGSPLDPQPAPPDLATSCFALQLTRQPSPDVSLPALIELSDDPVPGFVTPGRLAVREPDASTPLAPVSWWVPLGPSEIELVLGGGYTGYSFLLQATPEGGWIGEGTYCADMGVEPPPPPLPLRLIPTSCP